MKFMFAWLRSWFSISNANRHVAALQRECDAMEKRLRNSDTRLDRLAEKASSAYGIFQSAQANNKLMIDQCETTFEKLRNETKIQDLEIKMLVAYHTKLIERLKADTAIDVYRRTAAEVRKGNEEE